MPTYDPSAPPKKVRGDKPGDSKKPYTNPFRKQAKGNVKKAFDQGYKAT